MLEFVLFALYIVAGAIFFSLIVIFARLLFLKSAPFVPIPNEALEQLLAPVVPKKESVIYDLGCGDGRVLLFLAKKYPEAIYKGIEFRLFPFLLARFKTRNQKNITIIHKNFFNVSLSDATHIITYLFPNVMDSLLPKLEQELKNVILLSFDFPFSKKGEFERRDLLQRQGKLGSRVYVYKFE